MRRSEYDRIAEHLTSATQLLHELIQPGAASGIAERAKQALAHMEIVRKSLLSELVEIMRHEEIINGISRLKRPPDLVFVEESKPRKSLNDMLQEALLRERPAVSIPPLIPEAYDNTTARHQDAPLQTGSEAGVQARPEPSGSE